LLDLLRERIANYPRPSYRKALDKALAVLQGEEEGARWKDNAAEYEKGWRARQVIQELAALAILQGREVSIISAPKGKGSKWRFGDLGIFCCSPVQILHNIQKGEK